MPVTMQAAQAAAKYAQMPIAAAQFGLGYFQARKAQKELERTPTPTYTPSKSILDYYNEAKNRYSANPYESAMYKSQAQGIQRGTAQGLGALNDRRIALGGVNSLIQGQNDAMLRAAGAAEQQQSQRFGQLGQASQLKAGEDMKMFQYNQMMPYEKKMSLLGAKASGGNQLMNAGLSNLFQGLQTAAQSPMPEESQPWNTPRTREVKASTYQVPLMSYR
jgi:hypothetical protein